LGVRRLSPNPRERVFYWRERKRNHTHNTGSQGSGARPEGECPMERKPHAKGKKEVSQVAYEL